MKLYNSLTRSIEPFVPREPPTVTIYVCGPTVYDDPHLGHARSAYVFDVLRRYLRYKQFHVRFVRNVTDVDDKIIERAKQELAAGPTPQAAEGLSTTCRELAERYLKSYHATMDRLGLARPDEEPRATEHVVPDMTDFISKLLIQGVAYEAQGDVYFSVRKCPGYGRLSNRALDDLQAGARVEPGEHKQDPLDFALWKAAKPGEPSWNSPWGQGRPGWHIECSTMSTKHLGEAFDIHGGGVDLVFPHHENEIAQAQAAGKPFARFWVHNGLLTVNGEKMSKSLGNFVTVDEALAGCEDVPDILKMFFLGTHYRSPIDYTKDNLRAASKRFKDLLHLHLFANSDPIVERCAVPTQLPQGLAQLRREFELAMDDDLNTPKALAVLDRLANYGYQRVVELQMADDIAHVTAQQLRGQVILARDTFVALGQHAFGVFHGFIPRRPGEPGSVPPAVKERVQRREIARKRKDFQTADRLRQEVEAQGFRIEDTPGGPAVLPTLR